MASIIQSQSLYRNFALAGCFWLVGFIWHIFLWQKFESDDNVFNVWKTLNDKGDDRGGGKRESLCEKNTTGSPPKCDTDWTVFINPEVSKCFRAFRELRFRDEAQEDCEEKGARLAIIHSRDENTAAGRVCDASENGCWVGLHAKTMLWMDGSEVTFSEWNWGHPYDDGRDAVLLGGFTSDAYYAIFGIPAIYAATLLGSTLCFWLGMKQASTCLVGCSAMCSAACCCALGVMLALACFMSFGRGMTAWLVSEAIWALPSMAILAYIFSQGNSMSKDMERLKVTTSGPPAVFVRESIGNKSTE